jgi:polysaccharide biosynthesis protein PelE
MSSLAIGLRTLRALPLIAPSVILQGYIVWTLLHEPVQAAPPSWMATVLVLQALAAGLATPAALTLLPRRFKQSRRLTGFFLWSYLFAVPIGGLFLTCGAFAAASLMPDEIDVLPISLVPEPQFLAPQATVAYGRGAHLKSVLQSQSAGASFRMTALMAMQAMPMRTVSPLLRDMLDDRFEDLRLLAFWMLDRQEKELTQKILDQLPKLALTLSRTERYRVNKELALLYNELVYSYLVQGDVYRHAAGQADHYAETALEMLPGDASLWRLRGRLALDRGDTDSAERMLAEAVAQGYDRARLLPYLAESAYLRRDFAGVSRLLGEMPAGSAAPTLKSVLQFWGAHS